jgi:hypothetical protein
MVRTTPMESSPTVSKKENPEEPGHRAVAPEANQLHGKELPPERIGQVLISGEAKPENHTGNVATMSRSELLDLSREITVDNTTLRHIYDTHLIGENGLRRMVQEHMRGGNLQEILHDEILEHETDFERDPQLRHQLLRRDQQPESVNLKDLLAKAGIVETEGAGRQAADYSKRPVTPEHLERHLLQQAQQRKLLDFAFIAIILILLILVILLAMSRG